MMKLLTQNSELREIGVWNWSLPAHVVTLTDGSKFNVCPSAGACAEVCYAKNGTYLFPAVRAAHTRNLEWVLYDLSGWRDAMIQELRHKRYRPKNEPRYKLPDGVTDGWVLDWAARGGAAVRIHDAGDFFNDDYTRAWLDVARATPDVLFYAYTKEVERFKRLVEPYAPDNFRWLYSMGGRQDHLVDPDTDRHAEVFTNMKAIAEAGYTSQDASDLFAITLPTTRVGIPANNIPHFRKRQAGRTFGEMQRDRHTAKPVDA